MAKYIWISITISKELKDRITKAAKERGISRTRLMNEILEKAVSEVG